jgi:uncharacterized protein
METKKIELKILITSIIAVVLVEITIGLLMQKNRFSSMAITGITRIVQTALICLIVVIQGKGLSSLGMKPSAILQGIKKGLVWSAIFGFFVAMIFIILLISKIDPRALIHSSLPKGGRDLLLFFIVAGLIGPVAEETFFRGILYGFLRRWGTTIAIFLSSSIFALMHFNSSGAFIIQFIGGVLFAASYEVEKNLFAPITIHVLGNLTIFMVSIFS